MGYLFIAIALLADVTKGFAGKKISRSIKTESDAMLSTMLRMPICVVIGLIILAIGGNLGDMRLSGTQVILPLVVSGITSALSLVTWLMCARTTAYMTINVFMMISTMIPSVLCAVFFGESITAGKVIGFIVLLAGVIIMCIYDSKRRTEEKHSNLPMLIICTVTTGLADFSQKWFVYTNSGTNKNVFNIYTYIIAAILLFCAYKYFRSAEQKRGSSAKEGLEIRTVIGYIVIMAVCLYINSLGKLSAGEYLDASTIYPVEKSLGMILGMAMSHFLLKEKMTIISVIGCLVSFAGIMIMNLL